MNYRSVLPISVNIVTKYIRWLIHRSTSLQQTCVHGFCNFLYTNTRSGMSALQFHRISGVTYKTSWRIFHQVRLMTTDDDTPLYRLEELRKRYKDKNRSRTFIDHCLLVASCSHALKEANKATIGKAGYSWIPEAQYIDNDNVYHFLAEQEVLRPSLCVV